MNQQLDNPQIAPSAQRKSKARGLDYILPAVFTRYHAQTIVKFIWTFALKGNLGKVAALSLLGVVSRFLTIASFAVALKAVLAALRPDLVLVVIGVVYEAVGLERTVTYDTLPPILISLVITVNLLNWLTSVLIGRISAAYNNRLIAKEIISWEHRSIDDDLFILDKMPIIARSVVRSIEVSLFLVSMLGLIFIFSSDLALFLIPLIAVLVVAQVLGDRKKLVVLTEMRKARRKYLTYFDENTGKLRKRTTAEDNCDRRAYFDLREHVRFRGLMKDRLDSFLGALALGVVIYYLFQNQMEVGELASLLIVFVLAIRQTLGAGKQLSVHLLAILELRRDTRQLARMMAPDQRIEAPLMPGDLDDDEEEEEVRRS